MTSPACSTETVINYFCGYDDGPHEYPQDWVFGGSDGTDPRSDPRWRPTTYQYYNDKLEHLWITQTPVCDEEAFDDFTVIASMGADYNPVWIAAKRPGEEKFTMLDVKYDKATDTIKDLPR